MVDRYEREIESLHEFFVTWYCGRADEGAIARMDTVLAPEFEMIPPNGNRLERSEVIEGVRGAHGQYAEDGFDIEIRNVEVRAEQADHALVRYQEWQERGGEQSGRISTVLFRESADAPEGLQWVDLHETMLEG